MNRVLLYEIPYCMIQYFFSKQYAWGDKMNKCKFLFSKKRHRENAKKALRVECFFNVF